MILPRHHTPGLVWVRLWDRGPGVMCKDTRRHPLLFSQRYGHAPGRMVGPWWVQRLRREP